MAKSCMFYECRLPVEGGTLKCSFHRNRAPCSALHCYNQAYARGRCVRHGARKKCPIHGCSNYRRASGFCLGHTATHAARSYQAQLPPTKPSDAKALECLQVFEPLDFRLPPSAAWNVLDSVDLAIIHNLLFETVA